MELKDHLLDIPAEKNQYLKFLFSKKKTYGLDNTDELCTFHPQCTSNFFFRIKEKIMQLVKL